MLYDLLMNEYNAWIVGIRETKEFFLFVGRNTIPPLQDVTDLFISFAKASGFPPKFRR